MSASTPSKPQARIYTLTKHITNTHTLTHSYYLPKVSASIIVHGLQLGNERIDAIELLARLGLVTENNQRPLCTLLKENVVSINI